MAIESQQLRNISKQIDEHFGSHKVIVVTPVKGDPPNQYEVTYNLPGMAREDNRIVTTTTHKIEISIPFGFPHFPPSCKPKSEIFHPDFDPAAICLGDFWHQDRTLPELITHIGRMINGEFYSTENVFDEEAAVWFNEHREELPFSPSLITSSAQPGSDSIADELPSFSEDIEPLLFNTKTGSEQEEEQRNYAELVLDNYKKTNSKAAEYSPKSDSKEPEPVQEKGGWKKIIKLFILTWILIHLTGAGVYLFIKIQHKKIAAAEQSYNQCLTELETNNFTGAKESCDRALKGSKNTMFVEQARSADLTAKAQKTLQSEKLQQGLNGKIFVDGEYLQKTDADKLALYKKISSEGEDFFDQKLWDSASKKLQKAIDLAHNSPFINDNTLQELTSKLQIATIQTFIKDAEEKLNRKSWEDAIQSYSDALAYLRKLPPEVQQKYARQLQEKLAKSQFESLRQKADALFAESDWQQSTSAYRRALTTGKGSEAVPGEALAEISLNIERAKLYQAISRGNGEFSAGSWDKAIAAYKSAQSMLADNKKIFIRIDADTNIRKLERFILQASVSKSLEATRRYLDNKNLQAAKSRHERIIKDIKTSPFANDDDFSETITESSKMIQSLGHKIFLNEKKEYLLNNFQTLFAKHYPSASPDNMSNPVITLENESAESALFKLQCTEIRGGSRALLIIHYKFDKKGRTWQFSFNNP
ncbi:MAG: hypothetical protein JRC87_03925 [Deltaproteobacteria bacterium]|nr:hypothetical protein [Deltaproteobacteria bacterium]